MKRLTIIILMLTALTVAVGCGSGQSGQPCEIYKKYASQPGLTVAEVRDFALCDSVRVNVVLVEADDNEAWQQLTQSLDIRIDEGSTSWLADPADPAVRTAWTGSPALRIVASHSRHAIGFYSIENDVQYDALIDYQLRELEK